MPTTQLTTYISCSVPPYFEYTPPVHDTEYPRANTFLPRFPRTQQGAIADAGTTRISYLAPAVGFCFVIGYSLIHFLQNGRHVLKPKEIVPAAGVDEEYAYDTTIVPSSIGGVVAQPLSKVRTIEESRNDIKEDQLDEKF